MTHTSTEQPEALRLAHALSGGKLIDDSTEWADTLHDAAAELLHQHARIEELEASESRTITQRDHCEEVIDRMADAVLGKDRHEWTSNYDYMDAAQEVEDRIAELEAQLSATPAAQEGWCDGCSPDNCCGCGPAALAKVQPESSMGEQP